MDYHAAAEIREELADLGQAINRHVEHQHPLYRFAGASLAGQRASDDEANNSGWGRDSEGLADLCARDAIALCKRLNIPLPEGVE